MKGVRFGRYELLRKLAAGGMAEIYLARLWGEGGFYRDVVIKRLFRHLAENQKALQMFQYEARLLAELSHPNIPMVSDLGFADHHWYLAMEYVDGHNLSDLWNAGARAQLPMPLAVAIGIVIQAAEALHHAHEKHDRAGRPLRIVHRDVTPHNIMLTRDGVAKLLDFGVAQTAARRDTEAGSPKGTFSYMAPEQVRARTLDKRADVFALGIILYELTTGTRLFRGNDVQVMTAIVEQDVVPPSVHWPEYPPELEQITLWALTRDRSRRMPSAAHLSWKLEELALRYQLPVGPRAIARYFNQVFPFERERDEKMALVPDGVPRLDIVPESEAIGVDVELDEGGGPPSDQQALDEAASVWGAREPDVPTYDDRALEDPSMLDDLQMLAAPIHEGDDPDSAEAPNTIPPDASEGGFEDDTASVPVARPTSRPVPRPPRRERGDPTSRIDGPPPALVLDGFEEERPPQRPVVLLGQPKKQTPKDQESQSEEDYVRNLERRFEEEDK